MNFGKYRVIFNSLIFLLLVAALSIYGVTSFIELGYFSKYMGFLVLCLSITTVSSVFAAAPTILYTGYGNEDNVKKRK